MSWFDNDTNKRLDLIFQDIGHLRINDRYIQDKLNLILKNQEKILEMLARKQKQDKKIK